MTKMTCIFPIVVWVALLFCYFLCLPLCCAAGGTSYTSFGRAGRGLVLIPGLGRVDRLQHVVDNLALLQSFISEQGGWDCIVYIYAARHATEPSISNVDEDSAFWAESHSANRDYVSKMCNVVENPGGLVAQNLWLAQPHLLRHVYSHILILLDDIRLTPTTAGSARGPPSWDLGHLLDVMAVNDLSVASPRVRGNSKGGGQGWRKIMESAPPLGAEGWLSEFVEIYVYLMTARAWELLWSLLHPATNPYAWCYDFWLPKLGRQELAKDGLVYRQGVVSSVGTEHLQGVVRADNAGTKAKWAAAMEQERFYKKYLGIDLKRFRQMKAVVNGTLASPDAAYMAGRRKQRREQMWLPAPGDRDARDDGEASPGLASTPARGLLVVPDLRTAAQTRLTVGNLRRLRDMLGPQRRWDCAVYVSAERGKGGLWSEIALVDSLHATCTVVEMPGAGLAAALQAVQPALLAGAYSHVFVLRAGTQLLDSTDSDADNSAGAVEPWGLQALLDAMAFHALSAVSPAFDAGGLQSGQGEVLVSRSARERLANVLSVPAGIAGWTANYLELSATLFTLEAYAALWELVHPASNPSAEGVALWYDQYCKQTQRVRTQKMGVWGGVRVRRASPADASELEAFSQAGGHTLTERQQHGRAQEELYRQLWGFSLRRYREEVLGAELVGAHLAEPSSSPRWEQGLSHARELQMSVIPAHARAARAGPAAAKRATKPAN